MAEYKDIRFLDIKKNIMLTQDTSSGIVYVKKYLKSQTQFHKNLLISFFILIFINKCKRIDLVVCLKL